MAINKIHPRSTLRKLFPANTIIDLARHSGALVRQRKIKFDAFFWALVLGFGTGRTRSVAGIRRAYQHATGQSIEESSFYNRFTPALVNMLKMALDLALSKIVGASRHFKGRLAYFRDILIADATVIHLYRLLDNKDPKGQADRDVKVHTVLSVTGAGKHSVRITRARQHEGPVLKVGPWVRDKLLLFDLGYFKYELFFTIDDHGGYFVSRLKKSANPLIIKNNLTHRGRSMSVEGERLRQIERHLKRETLDVTVEVRCNGKRHSGCLGRKAKEFRVVGVRDEASGGYHFYLTNIGIDKLSGKDIAMTYKLRWEIELMFKELKSHYRLKDIPSQKKEVVEALVYASLITFVASRALFEAVRRELAEEENRLKKRRWAVLFEMISGTLLELVMNHGRRVKELNRRVVRFLLKEVLDPNVSRMSLVELVDRWEVL